MAKRMTLVFAFAVSVLILIVGIAGLYGWSFAVLFRDILPIGGGLALGLDRLSAFFLVIIAAGAMPSAFYAIGYTRREGSAGATFSVFIASMALVVLARNVLTFLVFWEAMSLASYFL